MQNIFSAKSHSVLFPSTFYNSARKSNRPQNCVATASISLPFDRCRARSVLFNIKNSLPPQSGQCVSLSQLSTWTSTPIDTPKDSRIVPLGLARSLSLSLFLFCESFPRSYRINSTLALLQNVLFTTIINIVHSLGSNLSSNIDII